MNNNDQQFHDNSFEEEQQPKTVVESSYEYVFSSGTTAELVPQESSESKRRRSSKVFGRVCTAILCLSLAFTAGFGGSLCANFLTNRKTPAQTDGGKNLYVENPEALLHRDPPEPSEFGSAGEDVFAVSQVANIVLDTVVVVNATVETQSFWGTTQTSVSTGSGVIQLSY